ncbi:hypothetical protein LTR85_010418 [Meristemomyces frigidus]|nr:hypothetical protein LTR85_010418 [Meristemomyces frigidus]
MFNYDVAEIGGTASNLGRKPKKTRKNSRKGGQALKDTLMDMVDMTSLTTAGAFASGFPDLQDRDRVLAALLPAEIESSAHLTNVMMFKSAADKADWTGAASGPHSKLPEDVDHIIRHSPILHQLECKVYDKANKASIAILTPPTPGKTGVNDRRLGTVANPQTDSTSKTPLLSHTQLEQAAARFEELLNRFPGDVTKDSDLRTRLFALVTQDKFPNLAIKIPSILYVLPKGPNKTQPTYNEKKMVEANPLFIDHTRPARPLPANLLHWQSAHKVSTSCAASPPPGRSAEDTAKHQRAIDFLVYVAAKVAGNVFESPGAYGAHVQSLTDIYVGQRGHYTAHLSDNQMGSIWDPQLASQLVSLCPKHLLCYTAAQTRYNSLGTPFAETTLRYLLSLVYWCAIPELRLAAIAWG